MTARKQRPRCANCGDATHFGNATGPRSAVGWCAACLRARVAMEGYDPSQGRRSPAPGSGFVRPDAATVHRRPDEADAGADDGDEATEGRCSAPFERLGDYEDAMREYEE